jgi:hypothetical protein
MTESQPGPGPSEETESVAPDGLTPIPAPPQRDTTGGVLHPVLPDYKLRRENIRGMVAALLLLNLFITLIAPWVAMAFDWALAGKFRTSFPCFFPRLWAWLARQPDSILEQTTKPA